MKKLLKMKRAKLTPKQKLRLKNDPTYVFMNETLKITLDMLDKIDWDDEIYDGYWLEGEINKLIVKVWKKAKKLTR